jgi:Arc/MetJ-type ribon-helix-helix transcriptional regulator
MEKTTLYLPADLQHALRDLARRTGRSQADVVREAVREYVVHQQRPRPRSIGAIEGEPSPPAGAAKAWVRDRWVAEADDGADA